MTSLMGYDWIEVDEIESVIEKFPYLEITYKNEETFFIDWSVENRDRFNIFIYGGNSL